MKTKLFKIKTKTDIENDFQNVFGKIKNIDFPYLRIEVSIYENDKQDPEKKTAKSKLYEGYIFSKFFIDKKQVYQIQIDFMEKDGSDIIEKVKCILKSIQTQNEK